MGANVTRKLLHLAAGEIRRQRQELELLRAQVAIVGVFEAALLGRRGGMVSSGADIVGCIERHLQETERGAIAEADRPAAEHSASDVADRRVPRNELRQGAQFQEGTL